MRAYPRERGGTVLLSPVGVCPMGLSPRTRGNPHAPGRGLQLRGPIPANAGEPPMRCCAWAGARAYPRERGGTQVTNWVTVRVPGLSPRTRGNPESGVVGPFRPGPIPANAGEPRQQRPRSCHSWAYPRERGGTCRPRIPQVHRPGLSPRTRGNLLTPLTPCPIRGPIPANAGEPSSGTPPGTAKRAYPRERGGTSYS